MNPPLYTIEVLRLAASLQGPRHLDSIDGEAELRSPTCGSRIKTQVQLDPDRRVTGMSQQVHACAFGQAAAALLEDKAVGMDRAGAEAALDVLTNWLGEGQGGIDAWPALQSLAPARHRTSRHGAILLPLRTLVAALGNDQ